MGVWLPIVGGMNFFSSRTHAHQPRSHPYVAATNQSRWAPKLTPMRLTTTSTSVTSSCPASAPLLYLSSDNCPIRSLTERRVPYRRARLICVVLDHLGVGLWQPNKSYVPRSRSKVLPFPLLTFKDLILRRLRALSVYTEMLPCTTKLADLTWKPKGVILSGGKNTSGLLSSY